MKLKLKLMASLLLVTTLLMGLPVEVFATERFSIAKGISNTYDDGFVYQMYDGGKVSKKKTDAYIDNILDKLSPVYKLKTMYGKTITVKGPNLVFNKTDDSVVNYIKKKFYKNVKKRKGGIRNVSVNALLKTYIEISLKNQEMRLVKDGKELVRTNIVTGDVQKKAETVPGLYRVHLMQKNRTLGYTGFTGQWETADVLRWIRFDDANAIGIHDAPWRTDSKSWSLEAHKIGNGSHGCVNTPTDAVVEIYDNISVGTPVIVYK